MVDRLPLPRTEGSYAWLRRFGPGCANETWRPTIRGLPSDRSGEMNTGKTHLPEGGARKLDQYLFRRAEDGDGERWHCCSRSTLDCGPVKCWA